MQPGEPTRHPSREPDVACSPQGEECALCGDQAVPVLVRSVDAAAGMAAGVAGGRVVHVALDLVENVEPGDTLLVHQGFAIARVELP